MYRKLINFTLKLLNSKKYFDFLPLSIMQIYILNKISGRNDKVFKIKAIKHLPVSEKLLNGYKYVSKTQNNIEVDVPDLNLYILKNVIVNSQSSAIIYRENIFYEAINENERFNEGFIKYHTKKNAIVDITEVTEIEEGFFLAGNGSFNWYHWMIEILPKILYYKEILSKIILVDNSCKNDSHNGRIVTYCNRKTEC